VSENLKIWDQLRRVPPEHLKGFQRSGGFRGTAIKPMWTFHRMTEVFGPCGQDWGIDKPEFQTVVVGDEMLVYCTVCVWIHRPQPGMWQQRVFGVGGDKVAAKGSSGLRTDDEAFKKAYTDALTNALKLLGAGADVHMGLWDGNKYVDDKPEAEPEKPVLAAANGTQGASKAGARVAYDRMVKEIRATNTLKELTEWYKGNVADIDKLPPDWLDELRIEYNDRQSELKKKLAA